MRAHTVVLLHAGMGWETCEDAERTLRLPVLAFYTAEAPDSGNGTCRPIEPDDCGLMSETVYDVYRMVAMPDPPADPLAFAVEKLAALRGAFDKLEAAVNAQKKKAPSNLDRLQNAAETVRHEAEQLTFGLESWDATVKA
jgi:hypothetical protein